VSGGVLTERRKTHANRWFALFAYVGEPPPGWKVDAMEAVLKEPAVWDGSDLTDAARAQFAARQLPGLTRRNPRPNTCSAAPTSIQAVRSPTLVPRRGAAATPTPSVRPTGSVSS
jgi:hypothetical protein